MRPDREQVRQWKRILSPYFGPDTGRSAWQMGYTAVLFAGAWALMYWSLAVGYWLTLILAVPTAGLLMRLFMFQHDCGHGSYFKSRRLACIAGSVIGVLALTPYHYWRRTHAIHHAHSGNLDTRTFGDIVTITVREYEAMSWMQRIGYRLYRNPVVLFGPGAAFHFLVKHRFPWDVPRTWKREWQSVWWTNAALAGILAGAWFTIGIVPFLMIQLPITLLACTFGVWLFYVQHQFEDAYWHWQENWNYYDAALFGSSFLKLPKVLQWFTANIGLHHVHHLSARIPNYRLQRCHDENPELWKAPMMTLWDSLRTMHLALWDEGRRKLISFREHRRIRAAAALVFAACMLGGCGDDPTSPQGEVIEEAEFAPSLGIDLTKMTKTASGLYYEDIEVGTGEPATAGDDVRVGYSGRLIDGTQFDSGQFPFRLGAGQVVDGFDEGVTGMRVGGTRRIIIPPALGYGSQGSGPVPPNSILIFQITLLSIG